MKCLIRSFSSSAKTGKIFDEHRFDGDHLTIGRSANRTIVIADHRVFLDHAHISNRDGGGFEIHLGSGTQLRINAGLVTQSTRIEVGDIILIGDVTIQLADPPEQFELLLLVATEAKTDRQRSSIEPMNVGRFGLDRRRWSWSIFFVACTLWLALPLFGHFVEPARDILKSLPGISTVSWLPGDLDSVHASFSNDCKACHLKVFEKADDDACSSCHATIVDHWDTALWPRLSDSETDCVSCHREHQGREGLARQSAQLCTQCHNRLSSAGKALPRISDFASDHPDFRLTLQTTQGFQKAQAPSAVVFSEATGLNFSHRDHLDPEGLKSPYGSVVLSCANCHVPDLVGEDLLPISMEAQCQLCHQLDFDRYRPDAMLPHVDLPLVLLFLKDHFETQALAGGYEDKKAPEIVTRMRAEGTQFTEEQRQEALNWARKKTKKEAKKYIRFKVCGSCHQVEQDGDRWSMTAVRVNALRLPAARFPHSRHAATPCSTCHELHRSPDAEQDVSDMSLPGIEQCRNCHGESAGGQSFVATECADCHRYHSYRAVVELTAVK